MSIECDDIGYVPYEINPDDQFSVTFDISAWLGSDTIDSVVYSAADADGNDETANVLDANLHQASATGIQPYIKGGTDGETYTVKMLVTTTGGDVKAFYIKFVCTEKIPAAA